MNDLNGLNWSANSSNGQKQPNYNSAFANLKPTPPEPGRASPFAASSSNPPSKSTTPANDSFSNLVSFSSNSASKNLSLQEQQKRLADLKLQQQLGAKKTLQDQYAAADDNVWNNLGSGRSTPAARPEPTKSSRAVTDQEDDLFAVFNAPQKSTQPVSTKPIQTASTPATAVEDDDDDPFGLAQFQAKQTTKQRLAESVPVGGNDDDDVLGLLGKPVAERPPPVQKPSPKPAPTINAEHPQDKAVAELVDMGFAPDKARRALETTDSGTDVQAAVGWLLNQAHTESRDKTRGASGTRNGTEHRSATPRTEDGPSAQRRRDRSSTPSNEPAQLATEFGTTFLKTAGSLWKQGQKRVQQAVQEFNSDSDSSQPKWMRETASPQPSESRPRRNDDSRIQPPASRRPQPDRQDPLVTDEAMMLESSRPERPSRQAMRPGRETMFDSSAGNSRDHSPAVPSKLRETPSPALQQLPSRPSRPQAPAKVGLSKQAAEEQASQAYVSSARRRKPAPQATVVEPDLLEQASRPIQQLTSEPPRRAPQPNTSGQRAIAQPISRSSQPPSQLVRPKAPPRTIPSVSSIALKASHADREAGNEHFKRGDYSSAHSSYTRSLSHLPVTHPITIILLTNRALTAIKTGEPKTAVVDSDAAINIIGVSKGESETVDLNNGEAAKPMRDYYGKALMRKAEALEHMEKWSEAAVVWREAVESGHGGATAIQGRARSEKAANPEAAKPKPAPVRKAAAQARAPSRPVKVDMAAVSRLRQQNAAADKLDDEKFALADTVDAKINNWKGGKADNLRALLGSLDTVLWPEAGWKKISMADLVLPNKVKIQYMKGIAKVHPDKIPTTATTEQRMISAAVFSTLNEAWDKFKKENGL